MRGRIQGMAMAWVTLVLAPPAVAASFAEPVSDSAVESAITRRLKSEDDSRDTVGVARHLAKTPGTVVVDSDGSSGCPIRLVAMNGSDADAWNVAITVKQSYSAAGLDTEPGTILHVPFVPAHGKVRLRVECLDEGRVDKSKSSPVDTIHFAISDIEYARPLTEDVAAALLKQNTDVKLIEGASSLDSGHSYFVPATGKQSIAQTILDLITDGAQLKTFGQALAPTEAGAGALVEHLKPDLVPVFVDLVAHVSPKAAGAAVLLDALLQQKIPADLAPALGKTLVAQCVVRSRAGQLWTRTLSNPTSTDELRRIVADKCRPAGTAELQSWLAQISDGRLDRVLPLLTAGEIASVLKNLRSKPAGRSALARLLATTTNESIFTSVLAALETEPEARVELAAKLAESSSTNALFSRQFAAFNRLMDGFVEPEDLHRAVVDIVLGIGNGLIEDPAVLKRVSDRLAKLPDGATIVADRIRESSKVLAPEAVVAGVTARKLDGLTFLVNNHRDLAGCAESQASFITCAGVLKGQYPTLAAAGLRPEFAKQALPILTKADVRGDEAFWLSLRQYGGWSLNIDPALASICKAAEASGARGETIEAAVAQHMAMFDGAPCVRDIKSARNRQRYLGMAQTALQVILAPLSLVGLFYYGRRRWRKSKEALAAKGDE
jgi:hypothetical protein